jgi:hypothetical protein
LQRAVEIPLCQTKQSFDFAQDGEPVEPLPVLEKSLDKGLHYHDRL